MASSGVQKDINELKRLVVANGFKLVPNGNGHMKLLSKKGSVVTDKDGPVIIASTASDVRSRTMHVKRLLGVGALKSDPFANTTAPKTDEERQLGRASYLHTEEARANRKKREIEASKESQERTRKVRERIEPFVVTIGGWEKKGVKAELARAAFHFLTVNNRVERWASVNSAEQGVFQLSKGNTISERIADAWHLFMDEIDRAGDTTGEKTARYFELVAESKGLARAPRHPMPGPAEPVGEQPAPPKIPGPPPAVEPPHDDVVALTAYASNGYRTPKLALEALAHMDTTTDEARKAAIAIAGDILDMEIQSITRGYSGVKVGA